MKSMLLQYISIFDKQVIFSLVLRSNVYPIHTKFFSCCVPRTQTPTTYCCEIVYYVTMFGTTFERCSSFPKPSLPLLLSHFCFPIDVNITLFTMFSLCFALFFDWEIHPFMALVCSFRLYTLYKSSIYTVHFRYVWLFHNYFQTRFTIPIWFTVMMPPIPFYVFVRISDVVSAGHVLFQAWTLSAHSSHI